jgi:hypothetical protein
VRKKEIPLASRRRRILLKIDAFKINWIGSQFGTYESAPHQLEKISFSTRTSTQSFKNLLNKI